MRMHALICGCLVVSASVAGPVADEMTSPALGDVRLKGVPAEKMNDLFRARITSAFAQRNVFGEARRAFVERDDDERGSGGLWRGEFWGKLMLGAARVADYLQDSALTKFIDEECRRIIALQDPDGMTWGRWNLELSKPGDHTIRVVACDFESGSDMPCGEDGDLFSIWF